VQPTLFDPSRAPAGRHTAWAYCYVLNGVDRDMTGAIEDQVERFAPDFATSSGSAGRGAYPLPSKASGRSGWPGADLS
jgi:phytoene dehydrogenase-like protein